MTGNLISKNDWGTYDWGASSSEGGSQTDSNTTYVIHEQGPVAGTVATITYSNLKNSYYLDENGTKHQISKIVRTFSNLLGTSRKHWADVNYHTSPNLYNNANPALVIYGDPTDGFWYNWSDGVTLRDQFYDEQGNTINMSKNAYVSISSLNNEYRPEYSDDPDNSHVEGVKVISGGRALALAGSSISVHDDNELYSDTNNSQNQPTQYKDWDSRKSPYQFYGSGIVKLNGSDLELRFFTRGNNKDVASNVWAYYSTIIPQTDNPRDTIHYHFDVTK
ncbi:GbpC/Spa domain-containing protein [uncultured Limosilactobacillus sp.]|uniref:GbpC/Spa domain-containing protein n=1 Tax=uncultured Limosilactobacillus sp. TaxID=2837629 RepID=UPI0025CE3302|nr:GbpC/Spa domain-containing protein [uncultured Limosilactobacillus sp.]